MKPVVLLGVLALLVGASVARADDASSSGSSGSTSSSTSQSVANAKLVGADTTRSYFEIADAIKTDLAQDSSTRASKNTFLFDYTRTLGAWMNGQWSINAETGISSMAQGQNIEKTNANPFWEDLDVALVYQRKIFWNTRMLLEIGDSLPTGYVSQMEAYKSIYEVGAQFVSPIYRHSLLLVNSFGGSLIYNTYDFSPNTLQSNPLYTGDYSLGLRWLFNANWSMGVSENFKSVHFIDGANEMVSASAESITYMLNSLSLSLVLWNGTYDYNDSPATLYFDAYREVVSVRAAYDF